MRIFPRDMKKISFQYRYVFSIVLISKFDFDPTKSKKNQEKHGIDFIEAQEIWVDTDLIKDVPDSYKDAEQYWLAVGSIKGVVWSMIYNRRGEVIWIVSVRRARDYERAEYEILKN